MTEKYCAVWDLEVGGRCVMEQNLEDFQITHP